MYILKQLEEYCVLKKDEFGGLETAYILTFTFNHAVTTIRIVFDDYSGADLVITNMTTLPSSKQLNGYGRKALKTLLQWASSNELRDIRAVQVQKETEIFWKKNDFVSLKNQTNDFLYTGNI